MDTPFAADAKLDPRHVVDSLEGQRDFLKTSFADFLAEIHIETKTINALTQATFQA